MKKWIVIPVLLLVLQIAAQGPMQTIVTQGPVGIGEPFQVQYVLGALKDPKDFIPPVFRGLIVVNGPQFYQGQTYGADGNLVEVRNVVYTLVVMKAGRYLVPGASAKADGK